MSPLAAAANRKRLSEFEFSAVKYTQGLIRCVRATGPRRNATQEP